MHGGQGLQGDAGVRVVGLTTVYGDDIAMSVAYQLLCERESHENISHRKMPTWQEHLAFVGSKPYPEWWAILVDSESPDCFEMPGCLYVTDRNEIGVGILKTYRRRGIAEAALRFLIDPRKTRPLLANINPANNASIALFAKLGFGGPVQVTYELRA